jgi:O-antigen ligase
MKARPENINILLFILTLLVTALLIINNIIFIFIAPAILLLFLLTPNNIRIAFIVVVLLTITSNVGIILRTVVQITCIATLLFFFLKTYGLSFNLYKKIPLLISYYLILLFISMFISVMLSDYKIPGFELMGRTILFFIIAYFIYSQIQNDRDMIIIYGCIIVSGLVLTLSVLYEYVMAGSELINVISHSYTRSSGLMKNVNAIGGIVANIPPLLFAFLFYQKLGNKWKNVILALLLITITGELFTTSRASLISVVLSSLLIIFLLKRSLLKWALGLLISLYLIFLFYTPINDAVTLLLRVEQGLAGREVFWNLAINIIKHNFFFGIGPGAYKFEVYNYMPVLLDSWRGHTIADVMEMTGGTNASHNMYLLFFSDMGVLGLITSLFLPLVFLKLTIPLLKLYKGKDDLKYTISVAILAMGTGAFIRCLFMEMGIVNYGYITTDLPFWMAIGIVAYLYQGDLSISKSLIKQKYL